MTSRNLLLFMALMLFVSCGSAGYKMLSYPEQDLSVFPEEVQQWIVDFEQTCVALKEHAANGKKTDVQRYKDIAAEQLHTLNETWLDRFNATQVKEFSITIIRLAEYYGVRGYLKLD